MGQTCSEDCCAPSTRTSEVKLDDTGLDTIPPSILTKGTATHLSLSKNLILVIPPSISLLTNLRHLNLSNNHITELPEEIYSLVNLKVLNLNGNPISEITDSIQNLINLTALDLSKTNITQLPATIGSCTSLVRLRLRKTQLEDLPDSMGTLQNLRYLDLTENKRLNKTFLRICEMRKLRPVSSQGPIDPHIHESDVTSAILQFLSYRASHSLAKRFQRRFDSQNTYFADHGLQTTSWIDPRYFEFVRTLPLDSRMRFPLIDDPYSKPVPKTSKYYTPFEDDIQCSNPSCSHRTSMECPYRLCRRCCNQNMCSYHSCQGRNHNTSFTSLSSVNSLSFSFRQHALLSAISRLHPLEAERWSDRQRLSMTVDRANLLESSFTPFMLTQPEQLVFRLNISFVDEEGLDYGGLTREWFQLIIPEILNPHYGLFKHVHGKSGYLYSVNPASHVNPDHLQYFRFLGRVLGKAMFDGVHVSGGFTHVFYKQILGFPITVGDCEGVDDELFRSLSFIQETDDIEQVVDLTFSIEEDNFGELREVELVEGGKDVVVTDANKGEYIALYAQHILVSKVKEQMEAVTAGFFDVIPRTLLTHVQPKGIHPGLKQGKGRPVYVTGSELELLLCGLKEINLTDWMNNTEYVGFTRSAKEPKWFWSIVKRMDSANKAKLLQFTTGTSIVPPGGFAALIGADGPRRFTLFHSERTANYLPLAHTCFNQLDIPEYGSEEEMEQKLMFAISEGLEGFYER
ncbi:putative E3 ubiquitin-protein ligase Itchy [Blattamonas nauphoetae]|uniref:HECT-type E3 ubiquitin transferase n=1 Tax=Blattamonas nauphoetae TaxID=2049346 RepID=A0ABQ9XAT7_9EUKA|nr:putative E3 ubiquitin-protein ligase Itchy [Blattamonas nauphoetae]